MKVTCLYGPCEKKCWSRGLCRQHYSRAYRLVSGDYITWAQLEAKGCSLPPKQKGRQPVDPAFNLWLLGTVDT